MGNFFGRLRNAAVLFAALLGVSLAFTCGAAARPAVTDVRTGDHQATTRFVLDLSESVTFRIFTLANPYRVVIDLPEMDWTAAEAALGKPVGFINRFRFGLFRPGTARVVLDLQRPAAVKAAFILPPGESAKWRFVLDLEGTTHEAFMRDQGMPPASAEPVPASLAMPDAGEDRKTNAKPVVVIDPGHGGVDPGAIGVSGIHEKHITLAMARQLKAELEKSGRYQVLLTRERDIFIPLRERVEFARKHNADLFLSLHADAMQNRRIRGLSVYTLSQKASDAEAGQLADRENKADLIAGMDLSHESAEVTNILIDLAQRETLNLSAGFATTAVDELGRETQLLNNTHRFAGFAVLKAPDIPSILVELGYLSHGEEERALRRPEYRAKLASALTRSVDRYFLQTQKAWRP